MWNKRKLDVPNGEIKIFLYSLICIDYHKEFIALQNRYDEMKS